MSGDERKPEVQELHLKLLKGKITPKEYADQVQQSVDLRIERSRRLKREASARKEASA